jgi:hypothetical protein
MGLYLFFRTRRKQTGMRLKLDRLSRIQPPGERPLNIVFNYNGHSWDAYEVLGLPAGSAPEKVEEAYRESLKNPDAGNKAFCEAAYQAIRAGWDGFKQAK